MTPPVAISPLPAATSTRSVPAATDTPRGDAGSSPFDQHLQAARNTPPADASAPADPPTPAAHTQGEPSAADAGEQPAAKPAPAQNGSTPAASAAGAPSAAAAATLTAAMRGQADAMPADVAPAAIQVATIATGTNDGTAAPAPKAAGASKAAAPDDAGAASLAGAMLALLGRVTGGIATASSTADDATVSADGSASVQANAAVALQARGTDDKTLAAAVAAAAAPNAAPAGTPTGVERLFAAAGADAHKNHGLQALAMAAATAPAPASATQQAPAPPQLQLASPPGSPGFANELGQQVVWLGQQDIRQAKIHLHPQDLGSLDVHLSVSHNRVDVVFSAQHPAAVTAVQQSLPQLDRMLASHGLSLGHAEVGQQQGGDGRARGGSGEAATVDEIGEAQGAGLPVAASRIGLLDAFA